MQAGKRRRRLNNSARLFILFVMLVSTVSLGIGLMVLDEMINGSLGWCPKPDSLMNCVYEFPPPLHIQINEMAWEIIFPSIIISAIIMTVTGFMLGMDEGESEDF